MQKCTLFAVLALLFGLSWLPTPIAAASAAATGPRRIHILIRHPNKTSKLSGEPLIQKACRGVGEYESECLFNLHSAPSQQKADAKGLAFFTLRYVEDHAAKLATLIKNMSAVPDLAPMLQSAFSDCMDQYNPLDDLIEDAINAVLANTYSDAEKFIEAAVSDVEECDSQLKEGLNAEEKLGDDVQLAKDVNDNNNFLKNMLSAALNIVRAN